jgi:hypothetical protein
MSGAFRMPRSKELTKFYTFPLLFSTVFDANIAESYVALDKKLRNEESDRFGIKVFLYRTLTSINMVKVQNFEGLSDDLKIVRTVVAVTKCHGPGSEENGKTLQH